MKKQNLKFKWLLGLMVFISTAVCAQDFAERSVYEGSYKVDGPMTLEVVNKYGDVDIQKWDKDSIHITTEVYLSSSSHKKLLKLKDNVRIKYHNTNHYVIANTQFTFNSIQILNELEAFAENFTSNSTKKINVNYKVYIPDGVKLKVKNQYGDIYLDDMNEDVEITQTNGALKANVMTGSADLNLRFVQATIYKLNDANMTLYYSNLDLQKAISLKCDSKFSEIRVDEVGVFKIHSSRDRVRLREVGYLYGDAFYPKFRIDRLTNELDCNLTYGDIVVDDIAPSCNIFTVRSERTDVEMAVAKDQDFEYDLTYHEASTVHLPFKIEADLTNYGDEMVYKAKGKTGDSELVIMIKAMKRCVLRLQYRI